MSLQRKLGIIEAFVPLIEYPNYAVSNYGNVKNRNTNKILNIKIRKFNIKIQSIYQLKYKKILV